jgi:hypothetical protein
MRIINILAALTGALALIRLAVLRHRYAVTADTATLKGGLAQLSAATAGLAIAGRTGRLNIIAVAMILIGANIFAGVIYARSSPRRARQRQSPRQIAQTRYIQRRRQERSESHTCSNPRLLPSRSKPLLRKFRAPYPARSRWTRAK